MRAQQAYNRCMRSCEIYHVPAGRSFAWKWRHPSIDGGVIESKESYALYYECVSAALRRGYRPGSIKCLAPGDGAVPRYTQTCST